MLHNGGGNRLHVVLEQPLLDAVEHTLQDPLNMLDLCDIVVVVVRAWCRDMNGLWRNTYLQDGDGCWPRCVEVGNS